MPPSATRSRPGSPTRKKTGRPSASDSFLDAPVPLDTLSIAEQARYHLALRNKGITDPAVAIAEANAKLTADPVGWVIHRLNEHPWSKQRDIMESVRDHRYTMVPSCHGAGKALALDTPLATPTGWTTMGEVKVGDLLYDEAGTPTRVIALSGIERRDSYLVVFSDGSSIVASDNHLWNAVDIRHRPRNVDDWRDYWDYTTTVTTKHLAKTTKISGQLRWRVPSSRPLLSGQSWDLPIGPYTFGAWLGDGTRVRAEITSHRDDAEYIQHQIESEDTAVLRMEEDYKPTTVILRFSPRPYIDAPSRYLAHGRKDIPQAALRAPYDDRLRLLQGLMDTDGYLTKRGAECAITLTDQVLSAAVHELIVSLGYVVRSSSKPARLRGLDCGTAYTLTFRPSLCPFTLPRKVGPWEAANATSTQRSRHTQRTIISVTPLGPRLVQCVEVDSPSHLYLAGTSLIPTHNSWLAARIAAWWLDSHAPGEAFVVTSAPTFRQVKAILWREMARAFTKGNLRGRMNTTEWFMPGKEGNEELVAFGNKPSDFSPTAFQGIHQRFVLVIFDEACHDDQTDVMTNRGWVRFAELTANDLLLTMDPENHQASYRRPEKIIRKRYKGEMYEYSARGANYCVTPDHEMLYHGRNGRSQDTAWRKAPITELVGSTNKYMKKVINWAGREHSTHTIPAVRSPRKAFPARVVAMDDWLAFLGWYCSEGSVIRPSSRERRAYGVAISQKDPTTRREIYRLCRRLGLPAKLYNAAVHIHSRQLGEHMLALGDSCLTRRLPRYLSDLTPRQIAIFLDSYARGDGYRKGSGQVIYTSSPGMAGDLQELILKTGVPSTIRRRALKGKVSDLGTHTATSTCDGFVVSRPGISSKIKHSPKNLRRIDYDGMVYCARVAPEHLLFTRRDGHTLWSGNCGIPKSLFDAASSLLTNEHCRMLAIGNPDDPTCEFAEMSAPGSGCNVIHISAFDTPNFTGEVIPEEMRDLLVSPIWVNERKRKWGEDNPVYIAKVLGQFPETSESSLIPISAIKAAQSRSLEETYPCELGVDVGGGGDANVICRRRGPVARIILSTTNPDTMQTLGNVIRAIKDHSAASAKIDRVGIGHGACNRAEEVARNPKEPNARYAKLIRGVHVGQSPKDKEQFANLRAEGYWSLRERFMDGDIDIDPNDDDLAAQLCSIRTKPNSRGQTLIESKEDMKKRGKPSPDRADALMLAFLDDRGKNRRATWGRGRSAVVMSPVDQAREEEKRRVRRAHRRAVKRA